MIKRHDATMRALYNPRATAPRLGEVAPASLFLTNAARHYRITVALSKRQAAAVKPESVAPSQRNVWELSPLVCYLVKIGVRRGVAQRISAHGLGP